MNARRRLFWLALLALVCGLAVAQRAGETVDIREPVEGDLYAASRELAVLAPIAGDLTAAAQNLRVEETIRGDLNAAAENITVAAPVGDDVRVAGRQIVLDSEIGDHVVVAGESVILPRRGRVGGYLWGAGATVRIEGQVTGEVRIAAQEVIIAGEVGGDALLMAETIRITAGAHVGGDLIWRSRSAPQISKDAVIDGRIIERPLPPAEDEVAEEVAGTAFFVALMLLVSALVLYLLFPRFSERAAGAVHAQPLMAVGIGVALLVISPFAILLLFATGIGVLLALIALAIYLALLPLGWLMGTFLVADQGLGFAGRRDASRLIKVGALLLAVLIVGLLQLVPVLGFLIALAVLLFGLGALILGTRRMAAT